MKTEAWRRYLRFWRADVEGDVDEELRFHFDMREREYVASGLAPAEAHAEALRRFGNVAEVRDSCYQIGHRNERRMRFMDFAYGVRNDVVFAFRQLVRNPSFTIAAVLTLALGIGANGLVFGLVNAVVLRPLPGVAAPDRVIAVNNLSVSYPTYLDFRGANPSLTDLAAFSDRTTAVSDGRHTGIAEVGVVSGNYLSVLGVTPLQGRMLALRDDSPGAPPVAVLSAAFARRFFPDDTNVVGRVLDLNGAPVTIVGIATNDFHGTQLDSPEALWVPAHAWMALAPSSFSRLSINARGWSWLTMVGRLKPGATIKQAIAAFHTSALNQDATYPEMGQQLAKWTSAFNVVGVNQVAISSIEHGTIVRATAIVLVVVAIVLLIACANVANLLLARAMSRRREIGIRMAIGAGRQRVIRQLLTETGVLALVASIVGLVATQLGMRAMAQVTLPDSLSLATLGVHLDGRVTAYTILLALIASIVFGVAPALQSTRDDMTGSLKDGAPGTGQARSALRRTLRRALLVTQVALSLVLLIGAGLFTRSLQRALATNPGFDGAPVAVASVNVGLIRTDSSRAGHIYNTVVRRLNSTPGVRFAAWGTTLPLDRGSDRDGFHLDDYTPPANENSGVETNDVTPQYLQAFSIPLLRGRFFTEHDGPSTAHVVVINETMARTYWPNKEPLGRRIMFGSRDTATIVGVVRDIKYHELREDPQPLVYRALSQHLTTSGLPPVDLVVRSNGEPEATLNAIRQALHDVAPEVPLYDLSTFEDRTGHTVFAQRLGVWVLGLFSLLALATTAIGIYGVVAYGVTQRTQEIGTRAALGARVGVVLDLILVDNLSSIVIGLVIGLALSIALTRSVSSFLFGVSAVDAVTFGLASLILLLVGTLATLIPAWRATRIDPVIALRSE
ncbi:MAG TPA: ABC transporter permease [Gemmatimonadaceae bacterium]